MVHGAERVGAGHLTLHPKAKLLALPLSPPHLPQAPHSLLGQILCFGGGSLPPDWESPA